MTLDQFIAQWDGKYLEVAGTADALNQCVDLANGYIRDVLGLPIIEWTNAIDFPSKAGDKYDYIVNDPTDANQVPSRGDLVVWKPSPGHIAVYLDKIDDNRFHSFDENFPLNSVCHVQEHTYYNVIGWLHPKVSEPMMEISQKQFVELITKLDNQTKKITELDEAKLLLEAKVTQCSEQINTLNDQLAHCDSAILKGKIRPLVNGTGLAGWFTYQRSRKEIQGLVI